MLYVILIMSFFFEVSYGDGDSNALILPNKKMKKRKEMEQVRDSLNMVMCSFNLHVYAFCVIEILLY